MSNIRREEGFIELNVKDFVTYATHISPNITFECLKTIIEIFECISGEERQVTLNPT